MFFTLVRLGWIAVFLLGLMACAAPRPEVVAPASFTSPPKEEVREESGLAEMAIPTMPPPAVTAEVVEKAVEFVKPTPAPFEDGRGGEGPLLPPLAGRLSLPSPLSGGERMVIKNAEFQLTVANTPATVDRLAALATAYGGYVLSSQMREDAGYHYATVQIAVRAEHFEAALEQIRRLALRVNNETVTGRDVGEEFVDLEARLRNLEATAARIRSFLDQARNAEEALKINQQLSEVEQQIEQIKARMNYLQQRAIYSLITVFVQEERPTPTPTPTATPTPTVTPTPTPTPIPPWDPGPAAQAAVGRLRTVIQAVGNGLVWLFLFWLPLLLPIAIVVGVVLGLARRYRRARSSSPSSPAPPTGSPSS